MLPILSSISGHDNSIKEGKYLFSIGRKGAFSSCCSLQKLQRNIKKSIIRFSCRFLCVSVNSLACLENWLTGCQNVSLLTFIFTEDVNANLLDTNKGKLL